MAWFFRNHSLRNRFIRKTTETTKIDLGNLIGVKLEKFSTRLNVTAGVNLTDNIYVSKEKQN